MAQKEIGFTQHLESRRLVDVVCDKFGQLSAETPNILWVWSENRALLELDVEQIMLELKQRAEQHDADLFARHHFAKPADFIRDYQRLIALVLQHLPAPGTDRAYLIWQNRDSKRPLPSKVANLLPTLMTTNASPAFAANEAT